MNQAGPSCTGRHILAGHQCVIDLGVKIVYNGITFPASSSSSNAVLWCYT